MSKKVYEIANPLQIRHFLFGFKSLSHRQKLNSIGFAVRKCFPYNPDDLKIDYCDLGKKILAFACEKTVYEDLMKKNTDIISVCFLFKKKYRDNTVLCFFRNCILVQKNIRGNTEFIKTFRYDNSFFDFYNNELSKDQNTVYFKTYDCDLQKLSFSITLSEKEILLIDSLTEKSSVKKPIFKKKNHGFIKSMMLVIFMLISVLFHIRIRNEWKSREELYSKTKAELALYKKSLENKTVLEPELKKMSIPLIFEKLSSLDEKFNVDSFSYNDDFIDMEVSVSSASDFLSALEKSDWIESSLLKSCSVTSGSEKAVFSIKVRYD